MKKLMSLNCQKVLFLLGIRSILFHSILADLVGAKGLAIDDRAGCCAIVVFSQCLYCLDATYLKLRQLI